MNYLNYIKKSGFKKSTTTYFVEKTYYVKGKIITSVFEIKKPELYKYKDHKYDIYGINFEIEGKDLLEKRINQYEYKFRDEERIVLQLMLREKRMIFMFLSSKKNGSVILVRQLLELKEIEITSLDSILSEHLPQGYYREYILEKL